MGVIKVKAPWQLELDGTMSLQAALADDALGPSVAEAIQQVGAVARTRLCGLQLLLSVMEQGY